jgi:hypothetical protein
MLRPFNLQQAHGTGSVAAAGTGGHPIEYDIVSYVPAETGTSAESKLDLGKIEAPEQLQLIDPNSTEKVQLHHDVALHALSYANQ